MAKKKIAPPKRAPSKHQLTQWEKQKKRQHIVFITGVVIIAAVFLVIGAGWFFSSYQPMNQTVIKVNDANIKMSLFIDKLKFYGKSQPQSLGFMIDSIVDNIKTWELIRQEATKLNITVSDAEVNTELKSGKTPLGQEYFDSTQMSLLQEKLQTDYFDAKVPASAEQRQLNAIFLESETQAQEVRARLENGEKFEDLAGTLSVDSYTKSVKGDFGWRPKSVLEQYLSNSVLVEKAFTPEAVLLSQPLYDDSRNKSVGYWILKITERKADTGEVHVFAILVGNLEEANKVKARLEKGEDFITVAKEVSQHSNAKDNGGDLNFIAKGSLSTVVDEFAFNEKTELNKLSNPLRDEGQSTKGGYWIYKVIGIENKPIEGENRDILTSKLLSDWVSEIIKDPNVKFENLLTDELKKFAMEQAQKALLKVSKG